MTFLLQRGDGKYSFAHMDMSDIVPRLVFSSGPNLARQFSSRQEAEHARMKYGQPTDQIVEVPTTPLPATKGGEHGE